MEKADIIVTRRYQKADQFASVFVREVSGGDIDGSMFQLEVFHNNVEDLKSRDTSGDMFHIRRLFLNKLLDFLDDGWQKHSSMVCGHKHSSDFNPEAL
jgi:alkyl hydroperoxide reductase subunit AhpF